LIQSKGDGKLVAVDREGHEVSMCPCGKTHYPMGKIAKKQSNQLFEISFGDQTHYL